MDEARRSHFPFHSYCPSQPASAQEALAVQHHESSDVERQSPTQSATPPKPRSPPLPPNEPYGHDSAQADRPFASSLDPRRSLSLPPAASDVSNGYAEKKERPLSEATTDRIEPSGLQPAWSEADKEAYGGAGYPSGSVSGDSSRSPPPETTPWEKKKMCGAAQKFLIIRRFLGMD